MDWAFTVLSFFAIAVLIVAYIKKPGILNLFATLQLDVPTFTHFVMSIWFLPVLCLIPFSLLVWTLNPNSLLSTGDRRYLLLGAFGLCLVGAGLFGYATMLPFKSAHAMIQAMTNNGKGMTRSTQETSATTTTPKKRTTSKKRRRTTN